MSTSSLPARSPVCVKASGVPLASMMEAMVALEPERAMLMFDEHGTCTHISSSTDAILNLDEESLLTRSFDEIHTFPDASLKLDVSQTGRKRPFFEEVRERLRRVSSLTHSCRRHAIEITLTKITINRSGYYNGVLASYKKRAVSAPLIDWSVVLEHVPFGALVANTEGDILHANERLFHLMAHHGPLERLLDPAHVAMYTPRGEKLNAEDCLITRALSTGDRLQNETILLDLPDGTQRRVECSAIHLPDGAPERLLIEMRDVSERYARESSKGEILSIASHELRTPLTPLCGLLALIEDEAERTGHVEVELVRKAQRQTDRLRRLIEGLLDLSIVETGKFSYSKKRHDLREVVDELLAQHCVRHGDARFEITLPERPMHLFVDAVGIEQVLHNLLDNALKYSTGARPIHVRLYAHDGAARLVVRDHGLGFSPHEGADLFRCFSQGKNAIASSQGSLGIGLYVCRRIVEEHGGQITMQSMPGEGTTVIVTLPMDSA